jgi:hypothetical protein
VKHQRINFSLIVLASLARPAVVADIRRNVSCDMRNINIRDCIYGLAGSSNLSVDNRFISISRDRLLLVTRSPSYFLLASSCWQRDAVCCGSLQRRLDAYRIISSSLASMSNEDFLPGLAVDGSAYNGSRMDSRGTIYVEGQKKSTTGAKELDGSMTMCQ